MSVSGRNDVSKDRVAALRQRIADGTYEVDARLVVDAIVRGPIEFDPSGRVHCLDRAPEPQVQSAPAPPSLNDLARAQLNRYAIDLKRSYRRELTRTAELEERAVATVRALAAAVAERDDDTGNHVQRVHDLGLLLAQQVIPESAEDPELA